MNVIFISSFFFDRSLCFIMENNNALSLSGEHEVLPVKRKKGVSNASNYKRNVIKDAILKGKAYTSHSDKLIPACSIGESCR